MATNGYVKAVGNTRILTRHNEGGESVSVPGYVSWQEMFFFDGRDPDSVKRAHSAAERHAVSKQGRLSIYGCPEMSGPWDDLPRVGEGIGSYEEEN